MIAVEGGNHAPSYELATAGKPSRGQECPPYVSLYVKVRRTSATLTLRWGIWLRRSGGGWHDRLKGNSIAAACHVQEQQRAQTEEP